MNFRLLRGDPLRDQGVWLAPLAMVSLFLFGLSVTAPSVVHHDLWHEMALAREMVQTGHLPRADSFAYTPTVVPVVNHEWGAGLIGLLLVQVGGGNALALFNLCLLGAISTLLALRLRADRIPLLLAAPAALIPIGLGVLSLPIIVAQTYTVLACALLLLLLKFDECGNRRWIAPWLAVCALWVNVHGGLVIGLAIIGAHAIERAVRGEPWKHLAVTMAGMVAAVSLTPYGLSYYGYILRALTMPRPIITEWNSKWLVSEITIQQVLFLASLCPAAVIVWRQGWRNCQGILMVAVLAVAAASATKAVPFYAMAWLITVPRAMAKTGLADFAQRLVREETGTLLVILSTVALASGWGLYQRPFWSVRVPGSRLAGNKSVYYPVGPVDYLKKHSFGGNVMTDFMDGSFVSWKLPSQVKVGCDSRYEAAYPTEFVERVVRMYRTGDLKTLEVIARMYPTDLALARTMEPLAKKIEDSRAWRKVYEDDAYQLFARPGLALQYEQRKGEKIMGTVP